VTGEEEQRIRDRAYFIWEQEGRPQGRELDHRLRAEAEIATERSRESGAAKSKPAQHIHGDDSEPRASARQAAEALFTPQREGTKRLSRVRKPRVLPVLPPATAHEEEIEQPRSSEQQTVPKIARSQFARIHTLVRYGMTVRQVAEVYGVDVGEIERIMRVR
jgi:hypothetical protein